MKKSEYQEYVAKKWSSGGTEKEFDLRDDFIMTTGLGGEAGEVQEILKKWVRGNYKSLDLNHLREELGDVLYYLTMICVRHGFTLDEVIEANVVKLNARYKDR